MADLMMLPRALFLVALGSVVCVSASADEIRFVDGTTQKDCTVTEETFNTVVFTIKAGDSDIKQQRPAREVSSITYSKQPANLTQGKALLGNGDYDGALSALTAAQKEGPAWSKQHAFFYAAECQLAKGDGDAAVKTYENLLTQFPNTRFRAEARLGQVRGLVMKKDLAGARTALTAAEGEIKEKQLGPIFEMKAQLEGARLAAAANGWKGALEKFGKVATGAASFPDVVAEAKVGMAQGLAETGDHGRAASELRPVLVADTLPDHLAAKAYLILGDCHKKASKPRDAALAYLRVVVLYGGMPGEAPRAYWEAAKLIKGLPELGGDKRAADLMDELKQRYPRSEWASKAI
jgi:TolA-binding protein